MTEEQRLLHLKTIETSIDRWLQKWQTFSWNYYFSDLQKKWLYKYFSLLFGFTFLLKPLQLVFDNHIVEGIISETPHGSLLAELLLFALGLYTFSFFSDQIRKNLMVSPSSVISSVTIFLFYKCYFWIYGDYTFYMFSACPSLSYATVVLLFFLIRFSSYKSFFKSTDTSPSHLSFVEDIPSLTHYDDAFGNTGYAASLAAHINATVAERAFAIAVLGGWGTGKTDFLQRLRAIFSADNGGNIVLDFNPWKVKSDAIVEEFFRILSEELRPYNRSITADIKDYSRRILQTGKEAHFRMLDAILNDMAGDDSIQKQYEKINDAIKLTGKRIVVLIDDLDRLTGKEIMEVLRIIRNTANFSNTFFVVGMDKKYTIQVMTNAKEFAFEEEYLKKIFQLTIMLPAFKKEVLVGQARKILITNDMDATDQHAVSEVIDRLSYNMSDPIDMFYPSVDPSHIIEKMLTTMRDLKRFANSFKLAYQILKENIELQDLFVLELIRTRDIDTYNLLRDRSLLSFNTKKTSEYVLNDEEWQKTYPEEDKPAQRVSEIADLKDAINYLLSPREKNPRRFAEISNFYLYFSFQHFNLIKLKEFNGLLGYDGDKIYLQFDQWEKENKGAELRTVIDELNFFSDKEALFKMVIVYMRMGPSEAYWWDKAKRLIFDKREGNKKQYFSDNDSEVADFLARIASEKSISNTAKSYQFHPFLKEEIENSGEGAIDKTRLQEFMFGFLKDELNKSTDIQSVMSILYNNWDSLNHESRIITLNQDALKLVEDTLLNNNELFKSYITTIFRPYGTPYTGSLVFEPFVGRIFSDIEQFLAKLKRTSFLDEDLQIVKIEVTNRITDFLASNGRHFRIEDQKHKKAIESVMRNNGIPIENDGADSFFTSVD